MTELENLKQENEHLHQRIAELEASQNIPKALTEQDMASRFEQVEKLTNNEIFRFGRQLVTPGFGYECKSISLSF
jgi:adenylyltransferase/sulfurtransferase